MMEETLRDWQDQWANAGAPVQRIHAASLDQANRVIDFQTQRSRAYADMIFQRARAALEIDVKDPEALQAFVQEQGEWIQELSRQLGNDLRTLGTLNEEMAQALQSAVVPEDSETAATPAQAAQAAANEAPAAADEGEAAPVASNAAGSESASPDSGATSTKGTAKGSRSAGTRGKRASSSRSKSTTSS